MSLKQWWRCAVCGRLAEHCETCTGRTYVSGLVEHHEPTKMTPVFRLGW